MAKWLSDERVLDFWEGRSNQFDERRVRGASRVVLDPHAENARAIRSYEKCGFAKVKFLPEREAHDGVMVDCWLMEVTPHTFRNG